MMLAMLQVDHAHYSAPAHQGHRQKCLVSIFRELMEKLKARIERCVFRNRNRFLVFRHPAGNSLPQAESEAINHIGM